MGRAAAEVVQNSVEQLVGFAGALTLFERLVGALHDRETMRMTHDELEDLLSTEGNALLRQLLQAHLDARQGGKVAGGKVEGADGVERSRVRELPRNLETRFGTVVVNRTGYGSPGTDSLVPMDGALNLPEEKYSFTLQRIVAEEAAKGSFDNVVELVEKHTGAHVPKRQAEEIAASAATDFTEFYRNRHQHALLGGADASTVLVITGDGVGIRVLPRARRDKKLRVEKVKGSGLLERLGTGEKPGLARMATVAAVYTVKPFPRDAQDVLGPPRPATPPRPRPENKRVWASIVDDAKAVFAAAFDEACYRDPKRQKRWVVLLDGNAHQIKVVEELARKHRVKITIVVDIYHVSEYVWKAAHAFHPDDESARKQWVAERLMGILEGNCSHVAAGMRRSATLQALSSTTRKPVDACARYLLNKKKYLAYDAYLTAGLPVGTGVIEGAGRNLIKDRMDIAGARWGIETAEAVLQLRALRCSGDLDEYWQFHLKQEHQRNHAAHYKAGVVPDSGIPDETPAKPKLRLVTS